MTALTRAQNPGGIDRPASRPRRLIAGIVAALLAASGIVVISPPTVTHAATESENPFAAVDGFTIVSLGDAEFSFHEIEGSAAIGGKLSSKAPGPFAFVHAVAGSPNYTIPSLNGMPVRLLAGSYDAANSSQRIRVTSGGDGGQAARQGRGVIGSTGGGVGVFARGAGVCIAMSNDCPDKSIEQSNFAQTTAQAVNSTAFSHFITPAEQAGLKAWGDRIATGGILNTATTTISNSGTEREMILTANKVNVWNVDASALPSGEWKIRFGAVKPSANNPLIINLSAANNALANLPTEFVDAYSGQGGSTNNLYAPYVLWNIVQPDGSTIQLQSGGIVPGSFLAPNSHVITPKGNKTLIEGQIVVKSGAFRHDGEIHHYGFSVPLQYDVPDTGTFTLGKTLVNPQGVTGLPATYAITYSINGGPEQTVNLAAGATTSPITVDAGSTIRVREAPLTNPSDATWEAPAWSVTGGTSVAAGSGWQYAFTVAKDAQVSATVTNEVRKLQGTFTVSKALNNPHSLSGLPANYTIEYSVNGGTTQSVTVAAGSTSSPVTVPAGSIVRVREVALSSVAGATWSTPTWSISPSGTAQGSVSGWQQSFVVQDGDAITATVTNAIAQDRGSFTLSKSLSNPDSVSGLPGTYQLQYSINGGTVQTVALAAGETSAAIEVPAGATVRVREVTPSDVAYATWAEPTWTVSPAAAATTVSAEWQAAFTVAKDASVAVSVENAIAADRGSFTLGKVVSNPDSVSGLPGTYTLQYSVDNGPAQTVTLAAGETSLPIEARAGSIIRVREVAPSSVSGATWLTEHWDVTPSSLAVTSEAGWPVRFLLGSNAEVAVTVTNPIERDVATLRLSKALVNADGVTGLPDDYTIEYSIDGGEPQSVTLAAGQTSASISVPAGAVIAVREAAVAGVAYATWAEPSWTVTGATAAAAPSGYEAAFTVAKDATAIATVTNTITQDRGSFVLAKELSNEDGLSGLPATYQVQYRIDGGVPVTVALAAGEASATIQANAGALVEVREVAPDDVSGGTWRSPSWSIAPAGSPVTVDADWQAGFVVTKNATITATVTNVIDQDLTTFTVTKELVNADAVSGLPAEYTIQYKVGAAAQQSLTLAAGETSAAISVPVGAVVQLREVAPATVANAAWQDASWSVTGAVAAAADTGWDVAFTAEKDAEAVLTVTNIITQRPGAFTIAKVVSNPTGLTGLPAAYTLEYRIDGGAAQQVTVAAGETTDPIEAPVGATVEVRELSPAAVANGVWNTPNWTVSPADAEAATSSPWQVAFAVTADATTALTVTNEIERGVGAFHLAKALSNPDGVTGLPANYTLEYRIDGGSTQSVSVAAGATSAAIAAPAGAKVEVREVAPASVTDATWADVAWAVNPAAAADADVTNGWDFAFTVASGASVTATATNEITQDDAAFTVSKVLENPEGVTGLQETFTIEYRINGGDVESLTLEAGQTSAEIPATAGDTVEFREAALTTISTATWHQPVWSVTDGTEATAAAGWQAAVVLQSNTSAAVTVTNAVEYAPGRFELSKVLLGSATDLVTEDLGYSVMFRVNGGPEQEITLRVNEPYTSPDYPVGTVIFFEGESLPSVPGGVWQSPLFSEQEIVIGAGQTIKVTLTNQIEPELVPWFHTEAWVNNDGVTKELPSTGGLVVDRITYGNLQVGQEYTFRTWLVIDHDGTPLDLGIWQDVTVIPTAPDGTAEVHWNITPEFAERSAGETIIIFMDLRLSSAIDTVLATDYDLATLTEWFRLESGLVLDDATLAQTGSEAVGPVLTGLVLSGLGSILLLTVRRRRNEATA